MRGEATTVVIGGSAAGLAVARCLQEAGRPAIVLEAEQMVGRTWRNAYERLHLHTPRATSGLPFMPMPESYPRYPARTQVIEYLEAYAAAVRQPLLVGTKVLRVSRAGNRWTIRTRSDQFTADNVVVATGNTRVPVLPSAPEPKTYLKRLLHASAYRTGAEFRGQRVLVVGFGNSAAEIAVDLAEQGASPTLSVRGPVNVIPREIFGVPITTIGVRTGLPARLVDVLAAPIIRMVVGDIRRYGLAKLPYGPAVEVREHGQVPVIDVGTIEFIRSGRIAVRPGIKKYSATGVVFADGRAEDFDAVVLATGYRAQLGDLFDRVPDVLDASGTPLVSGAPTAQSGLYFCGFNVTPGGMLRQIGIEAPRIAALIAGR